MLKGGEFGVKWGVAVVNAIVKRELNGSVEIEVGV